jgi:hypothetical protein
MEDARFRARFRAAFREAPGARPSTGTARCASSWDAIRRAGPNATSRSAVVAAALRPRRCSSRPASSASGVRGGRSSGGLTTLTAVQTGDRPPRGCTMPPLWFSPDEEG